MMSGSTRLVGLIGWPVQHSFSPAMHNAAFDELCLDWRYLPLPVPPDSVDAAVSGLVALGFAGANVTIPHKTAVMEQLDSLSDDAKAIGAVNTLIIRDTDEGMRTIYGHNTDCAAFLGSLLQAGFSIAGERAVVCGAGGAARAAVFGLLTAGAVEVVLLSRNPNQAKRVAADFQIESRGRLHALPLEPDALIESTRSAALLVNATPVGMSPSMTESIWPNRATIPSEMRVFDLVYSPLETRLLKQARAAGARALGGLEMLIAQGVESFELWTGECAPVAVMRRACMHAIEGGYR